MREKLLRCWFVAGVVVGLDQTTKAWIQATFRLYESRPVVDDLFHLTYVRNPGAAFGFLSDQGQGFRRHFFLGVTAVALGVICVVVRKVPPSRRWMLVSLGLIFGGALGNAIDRVRWGEVVDFVDVFWKSHHWPAFNLADSAITVGMAILILEEFLGKRAKRLED